MTTKLKAHLENIAKINNQRQLWLIVSSLVYVVTILVIVIWNFIDLLHDKIVWWGIASVILIMCTVWWYWTMGIIRKLMHYQVDEFELLSEVVQDIKEMKSDIKKTFK